MGNQLLAGIGPILAERLRVIAGSGIDLRLLVGLGLLAAGVFVGAAVFAWQEATK